MKTYLNPIALTLFMRPRGRPVNSAIRQNIIELLFFMGKGYGYDIYKNYVALFSKVTMRSIYYHLKKGVELGEFEVERIEKEKGNYSWGEMAEKIYYKLGTKAAPKMDKKIKKYLDSKKELHKEKEIQ
jgi:hypothetical protein